MHLVHRTPPLMEWPWEKNNKIMRTCEIYIFIFLGKKQDGLVAMLSSEPDFLAAKPILQEALERKGCRVLFGVKFHPELMEIESCYR